MPVSAIDWIRAAVQVVLLAVFFYNIYISLAQNKVTSLVRGVLIYAVAYLVCRFLGLSVLAEVLKICAVPMGAFFAVVYQPELRRTFAPGSGSWNRLFRIGGASTSSDNIENILSACARLVQSKRGALIVFPRKLALKNIIDTGTKINADITTALIVTVFDHDTPLHDGAMIVQGSKIVAAGCYLPLSSQTDIRASFGTRHRAALGMAEESDAVVVVVSEETGATSIAVNGNLYYDLSHDDLTGMLITLLNNADIQVSSREEGRSDAQ